MSEYDLLLGDTLSTIAAGEADVLVELVADGVMWRGTPVTGAAWAQGLPRREGDRTPLRERLAVSGYLHLARACYQRGDRWAPAGQVRLRLESVSAWWLRDHPADRAPDPDPPGTVMTESRP
jgi:hypothetical protein